MRRFLFFAFLITTIGATAAARAEDMGDSTLDELLNADRAFAQYSREHGAQAAWGAFLRADGSILPTGGEPIVGLENIVENFADWPEGATIDWYPVAGGVAESGELGWTWGRYVFTAPTESGETQESHGKYLNVWQKDETGAWKVLIDTGNTNPPPESD